MEYIKPLEKDDYDAIFELSQFAFQYELDREELRKKQEEAARHRIFGYNIDGTLAGKLHIIPLHIFMGEHSFKMGGISSVATWPEYRRKGIAKSLLLYALQEMKENGETVSLLHPFQVGFYRKYGWELTFFRKHYTVPIERLKKDWKTTGYLRTSKDIEWLQEVYQAYAKKHNGMMERDKAWWHQRVLTGDAAQIRIAYDSLGRAEAYIVYKVKGAVLTVLDFAYTTINGLHLLYEFIGNHDSMATHVKLTVPENDLLPLKLADPMFEQKLEPYFMARIVDVYPFLQRYAFHDGNIVLHIEDSFMPENTGTYHIKATQGHTAVTKLNQGGKADLRCSIQQLTAMLFHSKRASALHEHHFISGSQQALQTFDQMIPQRQPFFQDFF